MPGTPFTCCSIGSATVSINACALAPGYRAVTTMVGGTTLGYCDTGSAKIATAPISTIRIAMTFARTGRSIKNFEIKRGALGIGRGSLDLWLDLLARHGPLQPRDDDVVVRREPGFDDPHGADELPERHALLLHHVIGTDRQHIIAGLIVAKRRGGHQQRRHVALQRHAHAYEAAGRQAAVAVREHRAHRDRTGRVIDQRCDVIDLAR